MEEGRTEKATGGNFARTTPENSKTAEDDDDDEDDWDGRSTDSPLEDCCSAAGYGHMDVENEHDRR